MSDVNTSYDSDQLPGSIFQPVPRATCPASTSSTEATRSGTTEFGGTGNYFIGKSGAILTTARPRQNREQLCFGHPRSVA